MKAVKWARERRGLSQRVFARRAGLSFKGLQLVESAGHNCRLSSLRNVAAALGLPSRGPGMALEHFFALEPDSIEAASLRILQDGPNSWQIHLFDFVDAFRRAPDSARVGSPPVHELADRMRCLMAGTAETLCAEAGIRLPAWGSAIEPLAQPWFVAGVENLKATALVESPPHFRRRNIFVLGNFLERV